MVYHDSHVHTSFSTDSSTPMLAMVRQGIENGLHSITFTDHMDYHFPDKYGSSDTDKDGRTPFTFDPEAYLYEIAQVRKCCGDRIRIYAGVELGLKEDAIEQNIALSRDRRFDYTIGSIHLVDDMDPYYAEYWEANEEKKGIEKYFLAMAENLKAENIQIDTLGHLDYIVRYAPSGNRLYSYRIYADIIDEILRRIIDRGISLEVNTAGYKNGGLMPNPNEEIILRYREFGGELITFGSDAHEPARLSARFEDAEKIVRNAGFPFYTTFVQHKPAFHKFS